MVLSNHACHHPIFTFNFKLVNSCGSKLIEIVMKMRDFSAYLRADEGECAIIELVLKLAPFVVDSVILDDRRNQTKAAMHKRSAPTLSICARRCTARQSSHSSVNGKLVIQSHLIIDS